MRILVAAEDCLWPGREHPLCRPAPYTQAAQTLSSPGRKTTFLAFVGRLRLFSTCLARLQNCIMAITVREAIALKTEANVVGKLEGHLFIYDNDESPFKAEKW